MTEKVVYTTVAGIEICEDDQVPEGEFHVLAPNIHGGKTRYMFKFADFALQYRPAEKLSFYDVLKNMHRELEDRLLEGDLESARLAIEGIQTACQEFERGTLAIDHKAGLPEWMT